MEIEFNIRPIESKDYKELKEESDFLKGFVIEEQSGGLVGYATYFFAYFTWIGKSMYMDDLYVKPEFRGQGLGQKLIDSVIGKAREEKCKKVRWQVSGWNKNATDFYRKLGAKVDSTELNCDYWL
jgi:GNAT superfamily N-acetyltransferase